MKKERYLLVFSLVVNALMVVISVFGGIVFDSYLLMCLGYYTLCELVLEFLSYSGGVYRGRRASRNFPFGVGKPESGSLIFIGFIICIVALYIFVKSFFLEFVVTDFRILFVFILIILLKFLCSNYLFDIGKSLQSEVLISSSKWSYKNAMLMILFVLFAILSSSFVVFDRIGVILVSIIIFYKGIKLIIDNCFLIYGKDIRTKKLLDKIGAISRSDNLVSYQNSNLVKVGKIYKLNIEVLVDESVGIGELFRWELSIMYKIKRDQKNIWFIDFYIYGDN